MIHSDTGHSYAPCQTFVPYNPPPANFKRKKMISRMLFLNYKFINTSSSGLYYYLSKIQLTGWALWKSDIKCFTPPPPTILSRKNSWLYCCFGLLYFFPLLKKSKGNHFKLLLFEFTKRWTLKVLGIWGENYSCHFPV